MDSPRSARARTRPVRRGPERRRGHYGPRRIRTLYEISKIFTQAVESAEKLVLAVLTVLTKELPLRCAIVVENLNGQPKSIVWHARGVSFAELETAEVRALKAFNVLAGLPAAPAKGVKANSDRRRGQFVTSPLVVQGRAIFGAIHLEGVLPFNEADLQFVSACTNQLAVTMDRNQSRVHEIILRERAERETAHRRSMEAEVRMVNEQLEARVKRRTAELEETIKELHSFTYSIAHDLRAPLRHIHGFTQLLLESPDPKAAAEFAKLILAASEGMDVLIVDLLSYSRLTLEQIELEPISLSTVFALIRAKMGAELLERKAVLEIEEPLPRVLGHETTLVQAITNLIGNALKFTAPDVEPRIAVKAEVRDGTTRLWIEDNGIGIAPEHQERIFGIFQRLHRAEYYAGTGIGLAIVRRAMERMGGHAGVESEPGKGSRFWIELESANEASP
jgi:signal transduction histidine kinase